MASTRSLAPRAGTALVAAATGSRLPRYVTREQVRAIARACETTRDRLLVEVLWQSGGRISEVLRLRPCDVDQSAAALRLVNLKQRRSGMAEKIVYVSQDLVADLRTYGRDHHISANSHYFTSSRGRGRPIDRSQAWRIVTRAATTAGVLLPAPDGSMTPPSPLAFRHGSAVHRLRSQSPISDVAASLGHARLDSTMVYLALSDAERRSIADRIDW